MNAKIWGTFVKYIKIMNVEIWDQVYKGNVVNEGGI